ncbi:MAG TPA: glycerophosphodiester phosphodiesterase family protein [Spirochaetales bacterium]|nr:glycerophosphodiester phosphodiesterase family protein [Spirochaetales bacterium]HRY53354.1 glycerophosphodiester phosphodiesterase family protein [Spirochaetia bacterium]
MDGIVFGHRGAAFEAPENTMAGFRHAVAEGVRAIELDVHLSRDGRLAVVHDASLRRTVGLEREVGEFTRAELRAMRASLLPAGWTGAGDVGIPGLEEVLAEFRGPVRDWQIEIKTDAPARLEAVCGLVADLVEAEGLEGRAVVTSWDPVALEIMLERYPRIRRGFIGWYRSGSSPAPERVATAAPPRSAEEDLATARRLGAYNACIPVMTSSKAAVDAAHAAGMTVTGWLGDSEPQLEALLDWGVEMITTNRPGFALPWLRGRGFCA